MKRAPARIRISLLLVAAAVAVMVGIFPRESPSPAADKADAAPLEHVLPNLSPVAENKIAALSPQLVTPPMAAIAEAKEGFLANPTPTDARRLLQELRARLRQAADADAAAAIAAFLKSGDDAATGLPFIVGTDGAMDLVPTLRTALLDVLPAMDPAAALEIARQLMDQRTSPEEYALALRNLAWNDLDGDLRDELSRRFSDLLGTSWIDQPTAGTLESFDIAVELGGREVFDRLVTVAQDAMGKSNTATSRAAFMSLDRLIVRDPALLVAAVSDEPAWLDFAPRQRASLMARLDLDDPRQREMFTDYLEMSHEPDELDYFSKLFPNANFLTGHRLVTTPEPAPSIAEVAAKDARVLAQLEKMSATAGEPAKAVILTISERLRAALKE